MHTKMKRPQRSRFSRTSRTIQSFASGRALLFAASLALALAAASAHAQPAPPDGPGPRGAHPQCLPPHVQKQLATFDSNKNGRLDPAEHHAMREAERKADLATYDVDHDGRLSKAEHAELRYGKMVEHFEELDSDHNAEISEAEATGSCTPIEHDFARIDKDGDGSIGWSEFEAAAPKGPRGPRGPEGPRRPEGPRGPEGPGGPPSACPKSQ